MKKTRLPNSKIPKVLMKLEHKTERLIPIPKFLIRVFRFGFFAFLLIVISEIIGVVGYHQLCQLSWIDSFHMSSLILTGMGPVAEMKTDSAKIFSSFYALYSGVAFLTISAVFFTPLVHRLLHILQLEKNEESE